jgi:hypothetical protein
MLEVDYFSKWHQVMYHWLCSPNPNFKEIVSWYKGWKGIFPPELLVNKRINILFMTVSSILEDLRSRPSVQIGWLKIGGTYYKEPKLWPGTKYLWARN